MTLARPNNAFTLTLLYLRQVSSGLIIYQPVFVPFLLSRGMNLFDVAILQTAYNLGVLILDVPTGYFADRFGRKWALATANSALVIGTILIAVGQSLTVFIVAELFYALAIAMDTGIHSAYLFEWLRRQKRQDEYYRYDALGTFLFLVCGAAGTLVAGYFAEQNLLTPVLLTIGLTAIGIPAACLLPEQKDHDETRQTHDEGVSEIVAGPAYEPHTAHSTGQRPAGLGPRGHHARGLADGAHAVWRITRQIFRTPGLSWALGATIIWFWSRQYINLIISQPYFASVGLELRHYGLMYSIMTLASGVIALLSRRVINRPDLRAVTAVGLVLIPTSFLVMGLISTRLGLAGFFVFAIPYGLCTAVTNTLLNRQFGEHGNRATFLSIVDLFVRLVASILAIVLGWILARHGASAALLAATVVSGAIVLALLPGIGRFARAPK